MSGFLLSVALVGFVRTDISVSRTVKSASSDISGTLTLDSGCTSKDQWGSNNCDLKWGSSYHAAIAGKLGVNIDDTAKVTVSAKVNGLIPLDFTCPFCGSVCSIKIPVINKQINITLPPCPIAAGSINQTLPFTIPSKDPVPLKITVAGEVTISTSAGTLADVSFNAGVSNTEGLEDFKGSALECAVCKFVTGKVDDFLTQNSTITEIESFVEGACDVFPGGLKTDCTQFIEKYAPSLILALAKKLDPATICAEIKAC